MNKMIEMMTVELLISTMNNHVLQQDNQTCHLGGKWIRAQIKLEV